MSKISLSLGCCAVALLMGFAPERAFAQDAAAAADEAPVNDADIIVTARKRDENLQETPVVVSVVTGEQLATYGVKDIFGIAQFTPGLVTGESTGSAGATLFLRGIGSGESSPFIDQAVALNVDGVQLGSALIAKAADLDIGRIEVLRGPQALFFGKNSPGGVISLVSADPKANWEFIAKAGYEFQSHDKRVEMVASGPLSDTVGVRLAGRFSSMDGYFKVVTSSTPPSLPYSSKHFPKQEDVTLRATLQFEPTSSLTITPKLLFAKTDLVGSGSMFLQRVYCPFGTPQTALPLDDCKGDGTVVSGLIPGNVLALSDLFGTQPEGHRKNEHILATNAIKWDIAPGINLHSVTGYYRTEESWSNSFAVPIPSIVAAGDFELKQFNQELRLQSDGNSRLNWMVGGLYEWKRAFGDNVAYFASANRLLPREAAVQHGKTLSVFGQIIWNATDQIELSGGARYTNEKKRLDSFLVNGVDVVPRLPVSRLSFNNLSPEATIKYTPSRDLMLFASYKKGFKSGGFDASLTSGAIAANPARGLDYRPEGVEGGEGGFKSTLFDRQVTFNLTGYYYKYSDLQVSAYDPNTVALRIVNATSATIRGLELETSFAPRSIDGLNFRLAGAFNDSEYGSYIADCYTGQTVALGCNQLFNPATGRYVSQDLSGRQLVKAPKWTANLGVTYDFPISDGIKFGLTSDLAYSSRYQAGYQYQPAGFQNAFAKLDATARIYSDDRKWEVSLIGRNLTNQFTYVRTTDSPASGSGKGGTADIMSDLSAYLSRGREVMLQFTVRM